MFELPRQDSFRWPIVASCTDQLRLILPAGTAMGVRLRHASREVQDLGGRLSNTRIICPQVGDTLGKLRIIPHRSGMLERFQALRGAAVAKTPQCGKPRWGNSQCEHFVFAVLVPKKDEK